MENNLLSGWSTFGSVCLAILILLVMITIHEFGHYLAGRIFHFKINEFSVGFGPALFKRRSKKTGELFAIRLIPLGGYCAFEGEDGLDEEDPPKKKSDEKGESVFEEAEFNASSAEAEEQTEALVRKEIDPNAFTKKPCWQRIIVLVAGAFMNYVLALICILICFGAYGQTMIRVTGIAETENTEEAAYSLAAGDILLEADGKGIYLTTDLVSALNGRNKGDMVEFVVLRGDEEQRVIVMLREDVAVENSTKVSAIWKAIGAGVETREDGASYYMLENAVCRFGFWSTIGHSFVYSFKIAGSILKVLGELLTGKLGLEAFGGPVTTITQTSQIVSRGFRYFLEIAGYIGVNLAVFNLLPIPALDGCKVVFTVIEWIRKKPVSRKVEAIVNLCGIIFLFGFAILVDILQFVT